MQNQFSSTEIFQAAHNLTIQHDGSSWRLYNGAQAPAESADGQPNRLIALLEADLDHISCLPAFAKARNLPGDGQLAPADVARVVVGWAPESKNWHLGVLLVARPENNFQQLWCGLASWPSGPSNESYDQARLAGLALARVIKRPFQLVPAPEPVPPMSGKTGPITATQEMRVLQAVAAEKEANATNMPPDVAAVAPPVAPPDTLSDTPPDALLDAPPVAPPAVQPMSEPVPEIALKKPPYMFDEWTMWETGRGFVWGRRARWLVSAVLRAAGYFVLALMFLLLGVGTQTRGLAAVEPDWLPWLGMVVAVLLVGLAIRAIWSVLVVTDVLVDMARREVRCQGRFVRQMVWQVPFDQIGYILVSQTPIRPEGRDHHAELMNTAQEVWVHIYDGTQFRLIAELGHVEGQCHAWEPVRQSYKVKGRRSLTLAFYDTPAHHAAQLLADAMQVEVWLDIR